MCRKHIIPLSTCSRTLFLREFDGMQEKTPLWLALTRAMSSELAVVPVPAPPSSEKRMRTLEDDGCGADDEDDEGDEGVTSTS